MSQRKKLLISLGVGVATEKYEEKKRHDAIVHAEDTIRHMLKVVSASTKLFLTEKEKETLGLLDPVAMLEQRYMSPVGMGMGTSGGGGVPFASDPSVMRRQIMLKRIIAYVRQRAGDKDHDLIDVEHKLQNILHAYSEAHIPSLAERHVSPTMKAVETGYFRDSHPRPRC